MRPHEQILIYPATGFQTAPGKPWIVAVQGVVYEPESRWGTLEVLPRALKFRNTTMPTEERARFTERARLFMVDHQSRRKVILRIGDRIINAGKTRSDGTFSTTVELSDLEVLYHIRIKLDVGRFSIFTVAH